MMAPGMPGLRRLLSRLHLWTGLSVGLLFALLGLSGAVLVFHTPLLVWQHPALGAHAAVADGEVLGTIMHREASNGLRSLDFPRAELPVWQGYFEDGSRRYFSPENGDLLLKRTMNDDALLWLHELHVELLGGETGKTVLGVVGCICLALLLIGLYLWWPKRGRMWSQLKVHANPPIRRWLSWHRSPGVVSLPLVLLAVITGLGMVYSDAYSKALTGIFGGDPLPKPSASQASSITPEWSRIIALTEQALPDARLRRISVPVDGKDEITLRAQTAGEWHPNGRSSVVSDRRGEIVRLRVDARKLGLGHRMNIAVYPLHIGVVGGPVMRWLTAFAGLMPMLMFTTGLLFWLRRRRHRPAR